MKARVLIGIAGAVIIFGLGVLLGRSTAPSVTGSGIHGTVKLGGCLEGRRRCAWSPQRACQLVFKEGLKRAVARFCTASDGKYRVSLPPGKYVIGMDEKVGAGLLQPVRLEVRPDRFTSQDMHYDNGMRS